MNKVVTPSLESANIQLIKEVICEEMNTTMELVHTKSRKRVVSMPRHIMMYFMKKLIPGITLQGIADTFDNGYDHAVVIHALRAVNRDMEYPGYQAQIEVIGARLVCVNMDKLKFEQEIVGFQTSVKKAGTLISGITEEPTPVSLQTMKTVKVAMATLAQEIEYKLTELKS